MGYLTKNRDITPSKTHTELQTINEKLQRHTGGEEPPEMAVGFTKRLSSPLTTSRAIRIGITKNLMGVIQDRNTVGDWMTISSNHITEETTIQNENRKQYQPQIDKVHLTEKANRSATTAYKINYAESDAKFVPSVNHLRSRITLHAALSTLGIRSPMHIFDCTTRNIHIESVPKPKYNAVKLSKVNENNMLQEKPEDIQGSDVNDDQHVNIPKNHITEMVSIHLLIGNYDIRPDNIFITEHGEMIPFDYDFPQKMSTVSDITTNKFITATLNTTIEKLNTLHDKSQPINTDTIYEKTHKMAQRLSGTNQLTILRRIINKYDEFFDSLDHSRYSSTAKHHSRTPPNSITDVINHNITIWRDY